YILWRMDYLLVHSTTFAKQSFREKIVLTSSAVFPTCDITYLHSRVSQTYITTNHGELSSDASRNIRYEYHHGEGEPTIINDADNC
ncbi:MAG TPA: hypothetical protein VGW09_05970, partial [Nitrososphaeraceae archaeon]|nr:hypothetical protein [Nitrososphaeraceae archaeon]